MRLLLRNLLLVVVTLLLCPGLAEAVHDGVHQLLDVAQGEAGHAEASEDCSEHGCTPMAHHCSCCASMHAMQTSALLQPAWRPIAHLQLRSEAANAPGAEGVELTLQRPPRA